MISAYKSYSGICGKIKILQKGMKAGEHLASLVDAGVFWDFSGGRGVKLEAENSDVIGSCLVCVCVEY